MMLKRRGFLQLGGGLLATLTMPAAALRAHEMPGGKTIDIAMAGRPDGSVVWFDPIGVRVEPGQTIRWTNTDPGNAHTATAYHPALFSHAMRIPANAAPWNSDYLLESESFSVTLTEPGVYDYCCVPHEHAGMVGRIIVGAPPPIGWWNSEVPGANTDVPEIALQSFPGVEAIMRSGTVRHR
jgi:plastocyanin